MVHGGIHYEGTGDNREYLDDMWIFNMKTQLWASFYPKYGKLPQLAYHTMCVSNYDTNLQFNSKVIAPPKLKEIVITVNTEENQVFSNRGEDGIVKKKKKKVVKLRRRASVLVSQKNTQLFCFGGKSSSSTEPVNDLYLMEVDGFGGNCTKIKTIGQKPTGRFGHGMWYMEKYDHSGDLIIYGGRNDYIYETFGRCDFRDIWLINTKYFCWTNIKIGKSLAGTRYFFSGYQCGTKVVIFGGLQKCNYAKGIAHVLETDEEEAEELIKMQREAQIQSDPLEVKQDHLVRKLRSQQTQGELSLKLKHEEVVKLEKKKQKENTEKLMKLRQEDMEKQSRFVSFLPLPNAFSMCDLPDVL